MMPLGVRSNTSLTIFSNAESGSFPVPKVWTSTDTGRATPIAYASCTSQRRARLASTMFLATQRAAYAAERSTFDGSLPLNAPPPWRAMPPYVSTMILRPVRPASPWGPPITNRPVGLIRNLVLPNSRPASSSTGFTTCSTTASRMVPCPSCLDPLRSACWVDTTTVRTQPVDPSAVQAFSHAGQPLSDTMRQDDRQRHPLARFTGGVAEHHPLIA